MRSRATRIHPHLLVNKYVDGVPYANRVLNMSETGIALCKGVEPTHRPGAATLIELVLGRSQAPLWIECMEARVADDGCQAFAFANMSVPNRRIVRRFVAHHSLDS